MRWKLDLLLWPRDQETEFPVEACWLSQTQNCQTEQIHPQTFDDPFFWQHWHDLHALGSLWTDSQVIICWSFKGVQEEIPSEEASTLQIGSVAFPPGQSTSSQLHSCHTLFDQDRHQDSSSSSLQSIPCSLWLLVIPYAVVMRQLRRWKKLWRRSLTPSHEKSMRPSRTCWIGTTRELQPEEITLKGPRVPCVYYQWKYPYEKSMEKYLMILFFLNIVYLVNHISLSQPLIDR